MKFTRSEPRFTLELSLNEILVIGALLSNVRQDTSEGTPTDTAGGMSAMIELSLHGAGEIGDVEMLKGIGKDGIILPATFEELQ